MHHADEERTERKTVRVLVPRGVVRRALAAVRMRMEVRRTGGMAVRVEVDAFAPQPVERVGTQQDQHHAHRQLERLRRPLRHDRAEHQHRTTEQHQRQRVAGAPGHALRDGVRQRAAARGQRGDGGQMVGVGGMAQPEQEAERQDRGQRHRCSRSNFRPGSRNSQVTSTKAEVSAGMPNGFRKAMIAPCTITVNTVATSV